MEKFKASLREFTRKEINLAELSIELGYYLEGEPTQRSKLLAQLDEFYESESLPTEVYAQLKWQISHADAATKIIPSENDATVAVAETTRKVEKTRVVSSVESITSPDAGVRPSEDTTGAEQGPTRVIPKGVSPKTKTDTKPVVANDSEETASISHTEKPQVGDVDTSQQSALAPGSLLKDRFVLEDVIGTGGMSVVFRARDLRKEEAQDRNPYVAMKVLGEDFRRHPDSLKVLQRETQKAQTLAHPNIVTVYDFDRDGNTIFMTMECLEGQALDNIIKRNKAGMPLKQALPFIEGMARALAYAHKKNIIHSDFKPGNVFYTKDKFVKVLDFGIARARKRPDQDELDTTAFDAGSLGALTPAYASCEMLAGGEPDPRDDVYGLACITYELLAGHHPFRKVPANKAREANLRPARIKALTRRQWTALTNALAFDREKRTADVLQFLVEFKPRRSRGQLLLLGTTFLLTLAGSYAVYTYLVKPPEVILTAEQKAQIADYLETAGLYLDLGHLAVPPGDSAYDMFKKVIELDPLNRQALNGIATITETYRDRARIACEQRNWNTCLPLVEAGLRVSPNDKVLADLKEVATAESNNED